MCLPKRVPGRYVGEVQRLNRAFKGHVGVHSPEAAEVVCSHQQGGGLVHGLDVQLPDRRRNTGCRVILDVACVWALTVCFRKLESK